VSNSPFASDSVTSAIATLTVVSNPLSLPPFFYEPFDYTNVGAPVSSNTPANWTFGGTGANDLNVANASLSYPGLIASIGNSVTNGGAGLGARRSIGTNISSGTLYFSALFRINDLGYGVWTSAGTAAQVGALTTTNTNTFRLQVMVKSNTPSTYVLGVQKGGTGATTILDTNSHSAGETLFLVGKYDFTVTPNPVTLWINPEASSFGAASDPTNGFVTTTAGIDFNGTNVIDRFNFRQNTAASVPAAMQWDELRVGDSWATVTPKGSTPITPPHFNSANLLSGNRVQLQATGDAGTLVLQASTNLTSWADITNLSSASGSFEFIESTTNSSLRFYRLKASP
jgi:hypothetical protein